MTGGNRNMRRRALRVVPPLALLALLAIPGVAYADSLDAVGNEVLGDTVPLNTMWVLVAAILVLFMQAGFALLEIGFSRAKNAGTRSEEHTSELQSRQYLVCRLLLEKKKKNSKSERFIILSQAKSKMHA